MKAPREWDGPPWMKRNGLGQASKAHNQSSELQTKNTDLKIGIAALPGLFILYNYYYYHLSLKEKPLPPYPVTSRAFLEMLSNLSLPQYPDFLFPLTGG